MRTLILNKIIAMAIRHEIIESEQWNHTRKKQCTVKEYSEEPPKIKKAIFTGHKPVGTEVSRFRINQRTKVCLF